MLNLELLSVQLVVMQLVLMFNGKEDIDKGNGHASQQDAHEQTHPRHIPVRAIEGELESMWHGNRSRLRYILVQFVIVIQ